MKRVVQIMGGWRAVASLLGVHENGVRYWVRNGGFPEAKARKLMDAYRTHTAGVSIKDIQKA